MALLLQKKNKTECQLFILRYVIMSCIALLNICIDRSDPCQTQWGLEVEQLEILLLLLLLLLLLISSWQKKIEYNLMYLSMGKSVDCSLYDTSVHRKVFSNGL